jgi:hypothetical protein
MSFPAVSTHDPVILRCEARGKVLRRSPDAMARRASKDAGHGLGPSPFEARRKSAALLRVTG